MSARPSAVERLEAALAPEVVSALLELVDERVRNELAEHADASNAARKWLTLAEAGERLGCSADAIRMRVKRGRLVAERQGARLYVSAASVDRLRGEA